MNRRMVYFCDSGLIECWQIIAGAWVNLNDRYAFDDLSPSEWDYYRFETKGESWLGDRRINPMPYFQW